MTVETSRIRRDVKTPAVTIAAAAIGTTLLAVRDPHGGGYGMCPILALTGYQCPTCGGLRAVHDMAHLDIAGAWAMNPLLTLTLPVIGVLILGWGWRAWRGYRPISIPAPVLLVVLGILIVFGVLRNIL